MNKKKQTYAQEYAAAMKKLGVIRSYAFIPDNREARKKLAASAKRIRKQFGMALPKDD